MLNIATASNEPRAIHLFEALRKRTNLVVDIHFDNIDPLTRYLALFLSFKLPRREWWSNYQMHQIIQRKRQKNLQAQIAPHLNKIDALLMWGSWFKPFQNNRLNIPYYVYIDQSRSFKPTTDEPATSTWGRKKSYELQVENYKHCAGLFCMSEWSKMQTLESHSYLEESKVHVLGWGPCSLDLSGEIPDFHRKKRVVLHVSNDFHRKGVDYLLAVANKLYESGKDIQFIVIGEDRRYKVRSNVTNVKFIGKVQDPQILKKYFSEASVFILPHRFDRNPHVLVEAMSAGIPLVASAQGGAIEIIRNKDTGYLCPIGDIEAYTDAILSIIEKPDLIESMGKAGLNLVNNFYNWDAIADRMVELISQRENERKKQFNCD